MKTIWPSFKFKSPEAVNNGKVTNVLSFLITNFISLNPLKSKNLGAVGDPLAIENLKILSNGFIIIIIWPFE